MVVVFFFYQLVNNRVQNYNLNYTFVYTGGAKGCAHF